MKSTLLLLVLALPVFAENSEKVPSLNKALKLKQKPPAEAKHAKEADPFVNTGGFDPSFLLDVEDDFSFKDPLTDPEAAREKEEHPELSTQVSSDVLGIAPPEHVYNPQHAVPALPSNAPLIISPQAQRQTASETSAVGPETLDKQTNPNVAAAPAATPPPYLGPYVAGVNPFGAASVKATPPPSTPAQPLMGVSDVAVVLSNNQFFPSRIRLREGMQTRLIFATLNKKSAALIIEKLQIQRWIAKEDKTEITREIAASKTTEILLSPVRGSYSFYDAISGASGEITVE